MDNELNYEEIIKAFELLMKEHHDDRGWTEKSWKAKELVEKTLKEYKKLYLDNQSLIGENEICNQKIYALQRDNGQLSMQNNCLQKDKEFLLKENEKLKDKNTILLSQQDMTLREKEMQKEKIDKLKKELEQEKSFNANAIDRLGKYQTELFEIEKQLAITDKALDKACEKIRNYVYASPQELKEQFIKESEKQQCS